jgi:hypothetical protein
MREYPSIATERLGVFGLADAHESGWTRGALRHAVSQGRLIYLRPGAFWIRQELPTHPRELTRQQLAIGVAAVILNNHAAVASHTSAAVLHGLAVSYLPDVPCVTVPPGFVGDVAGVHLHRARLSHADRGAAHAIPATTPARTIVDIGREHGMTAALVSADAALRLGIVTQTALRQQVSKCAGWPGVRAARRAVEFADGRAESPLESSSRVKLAGLVPPPEIQASIHSEAGFLGRADFLWPEFGVIGEAGGLEKYDDKPTALRDEKLRQERLEQAGLIVVRWTFSDLGDVDALARRLHAAFIRGRRNKTPRTWTIHTMEPVSR